MIASAHQSINIFGAHMPKLSLKLPVMSPIVRLTAFLRLSPNLSSINRDFACKPVPFVLLWLTVHRRSLLAQYRLPCYRAKRSL